MVIQDKEHVTVDLDNLDLEIIRCLNENARKSIRDIAKELQVSLTTVSNRVKALETSGVIQGYMPIVDAGKLGYDLMAVIGIKAAHGKIADIEEEIAQTPGVFAVCDSTGEWNTIVMGRFKTRTELNKFVGKILSHESVDRTNTQVVLNITKDEKRVLV
jgi:Lrp/AsnC family transcriptional regulator for asnA, asnC and gidA